MADLKVSIITPVKNGNQYPFSREEREIMEKVRLEKLEPIKSYLQQCIESVLSQDYENMEHVLVDGGSTDGSRDIIRDYARRYPNRVKPAFKDDRTVGEGWREGIRQSPGDVLGWLGSDDYLSAGAASIVAKYFEENKLSMFVYGGCQFYKNGVMTENMAEDFDLHEIIRERNMIPCMSAFYKREVVTLVGLPDDDIGNDREYWIRIAQAGVRIDRIDDVLAVMNIHKGSASTGDNLDSLLRHAHSDFRVTLKYGGGPFAPYCRRYCRLWVKKHLKI